MKKLYFSVLCLGLLIVSSQPVSATHSNLKLRILPLDCVFETVNNGTNEIVYITPEACGQVLPPPNGSGFPINPSSNEPSGAPLPVGFYTAFTIDPNNTAEPMPGNIFLNNYENYFTQGIRLTLTTGQRIYFIIDQNGISERHSVTVKEIGLDFVIVTIASDPFDVKIYLNQIQRIDVNRDGQDDIELILNGITDGKVDITFRQLQSGSQGGALSEERRAEAKSTNWLFYGILILGLITLFRVMRINKRS